MHAMTFSAPVRSRAARAAHRRQASSHICFGPVSPVNLPLPALVGPFDAEGIDSAFHSYPVMRQGARAQWAGITGPKQMWELACRRCAARAALDLTGPEKPKACTCLP